MRLVGAKQLVPSTPPVAGYDLPAFLQSGVGREFLFGSWGWFAAIVGIAMFNTVLGEELLFRGLLLPRMRGAFGRWDWVANGVQPIGSPRRTSHRDDAGPVSKREAFADGSR